MNIQTLFTTPFRRSIATGAASAALLGFAALSLAKATIPEATVNYPDLDLIRPARYALSPHPRHDQTSMLPGVATDRRGNTAGCVHRRGRLMCRKRSTGQR
jgi:hypothetical protein